MKFRNVFIVMLATLLLTGCTTYVKDDNKKIVKNPETGQNLTLNVLCKPTDEKILKVYEENNVDLSKLSSCDEFKISDGNYNNLWETIFVKPIAYLILKINNLVGNVGLSIILFAILVRLILLPFGIKTAKDNEKRRAIKPDIDRINKKYENKTDMESMNKKSMELNTLYKANGVSIGGSCVVALIQMPILLSVIEAVYRLPVMFEGTFLGMNLGTTPLHGITNGNVTYIILVTLSMVIGYLTFSMSFKDMDESQKNSMKVTMYFMLAIMTVSALSFPTATAIYFITSSLFSYIQNRIIRKLNK